MRKSTRGLRRTRGTRKNARVPTCAAVAVNERIVRTVKKSRNGHGCAGRKFASFLKFYKEKLDVRDRLRHLRHIGDNHLHASSAETKDEAKNRGIFREIIGRRSCSAHDPRRTRHREIEIKYLYVMYGEEIFERMAELNERSIERHPGAREYVDERFYKALRS